MAQISITITDTPENPAGAVQFLMQPDSPFEPNLFDPRLTPAQALASAVLVILEQSCGHRATRTPAPRLPAEGMDS